MAKKNIFAFLFLLQLLNSSSRVPSHSGGQLVAEVAFK
jgi:hypothetical protein